MKKAAQSILLIFALGSVAFWAGSRFSPRASTENPRQNSSVGASAQEDSKPAGHVVMVTYFTTDERCESCSTIETLVRASVEERFASQMANGTVRFRILNLDEPVNDHFSKDYNIAFKTVVVSEEEGGKVLRWKKLDDTWVLMSKPDSFKSYVATPIQEFLQPAS